MDIYIHRGTHACKCILQVAYKQFYLLPIWDDMLPFGKSYKLQFHLKNPDMHFYLLGSVIIQNCLKVVHAE